MAETEGNDADTATGSRMAQARGRLLEYCGSLRGQIVLLVLLGSGVTSLLAAWTSTATIDRYLDDRIEERFPTLLNAKARELGAWYQQVRLGVDTFARSETITQNVARAGRGAATEAQRELRAYLEYINRQYEHYLTLYLLDGAGGDIARFGQDIELSQSVRADLTGLDKPRVHNVMQIPGNRVQIASAPVPGDLGASLHALIDLGAMDSMLRGGIQREAVNVYLVDSAGTYLAGTLAGVTDDFTYQRIDEVREAGVQTYTNALGQRVVGGAQPVGDFGWTLVIEQDYEVAYEPVGSLVNRVVVFDLLIGLLLIAIAVRLAVSVTRPIRSLSDAAEQVSAGDIDVRIEEARGSHEVKQLTQAFNQMTHHLKLQRRELEQRNEELQKLSVTDGLTGIFNHRYFKDQLPLEARRVERTDQQLALIMLDIDDFKPINDTWGHAAGDRILSAVAEALSAQLRATDLFARYGGEEFAVLNIQDDIDGAAALAEKLRAAVAAIELPLPEAGSTGDGTLRVTVSAGVALYEGDPDTLFRKADAALYEAKRGGKNRVSLAAVEPRPAGKRKAKTGSRKAASKKTASRKKQGRGRSSGGD